MAGDWIKMRMDLQTHPKVVRISSYLKADKLTTIGALHAVWCIFDTHSSDGVMDGYSPDALDSMIGLKGFCCAMMEVEWMDYDGQSLVLPNFFSHNGKSAKKRVADSERKREARMSAKCPQNVRDLSDSETDKSVTREEKRREENKDQDTQSESGDSSVDVGQQRTPRIDYQAIADAYNSALGDRLPKCSKITEPRKKAIKKLLAELAEPTPEAAGKYFSAFATKARSFHFGENDRGWKADFDFVVRVETLIKTREGAL